MKFKKSWKKQSVKFTVDGRPPRKPGWAIDEAVLILELRAKALEARTKAGLNDCFHHPVRLELTVFGPNIINKDDPQTYIGDIDSFLAGVCESLQAAKENAPLNLIFSCRPDLNPSIPLIIENDSLVITAVARKIEDKTEHYTVLIERV